MPTLAERSPLAVFISFGGLSGLGWIVDFVLLLLLVRFAHQPTFRANLISATVAATFVYLVSSRMIFAGDGRHQGVRTSIYILYTLLVIVAASAALKYCASLLLHLGANYRWMTATTAAALAKVIVTPFNFVLNFFVARITSEYGAKA